MNAKRNCYHLHTEHKNLLSSTHEEVNECYFKTHTIITIKILFMKSKIF